MQEAAATLDVGYPSEASVPALRPPDYYVIDQTRTPRGENVWVSWLGYPKSRNTWRSLRTHFPSNGTSISSSASSLDGYGQVLAAQPRVKFTVAALPAAEVPAECKVYQCRKPPARDIRTMMAAPKPAATERQADGSDAPARPAGGQAAKRQRRQQYETQVHIIRIAGDGSISETRGVRRHGVGIVPVSEATSRPGSSAARSSTAEGDEGGKREGEADDAAADAAASGEPSAAAGAGAADGSNSNGNGNGKARSAHDERSELWQTHRMLNEAATRVLKPHGVMFRIEISEHRDSNVTLRWVFPESSPGDSSAWIGVWDANDFEWMSNAPRPRYTRYKSLTSTKQEGTAKFGAKEWQSLPDGEYLFSIDTGAVLVGSGANSRSYCVSQRMKIVDSAVVAVVGRAHGSPMSPTNSALAVSSGRERSVGAAGGKDKRAKGGGNGSSSESDDEDDEEDPQYMFAVPLLEHDDLESPAEVKKVYAMVDRLSYLDWGLKSEDEVSGKRAASLASQNSLMLNGAIVHDGAMWGEAAHGQGNTKGEKTARTSEGYGEATCATAEKLVRVLANLTKYVPAMNRWDGLWNLDEDATFLDIGSGYGKVVFHAKMHTGCRCAVGVECVAKRVEISTMVLQGLYGELDRGRLDNDLLKGVSFVAEDACRYQDFQYSHLYIFDRVFSYVTTQELAKVLQRSPFYVMLSTQKPQVWWGCGLSKVQPVGKMRFKTTGKEGMTMFVYINSHFIPDL